jgi:hypothetical protein
LTPEKRAMTALEVCNVNREKELGSLLIIVGDMAWTLGANALMLVRYDEGFRVLHRP